ncbi:MAG: hypothetical protein IKL55_00140 [Clostridia bacterium]|nr:hypothetical protein [Clostridia bacterium]
MGEFKTTEKDEKNEKDEIIDNIDKRFNEELIEIKNKLNAEKLSDEFKNNLKAKLENELNKTTENEKGKIIKFPIITRKLAGICACFVLFCSGCFAFADEIENVIFNIFCNTDYIVERAIANGNYREIDMEYVENNGVSIKVDYVVVEDDRLYIAFNVLGEDEFDRISIEEIDIRNEENEILYTNENAKINTSFVPDQKHVNSRNSIVTYKLINIDKFSKLIFKITGIDLIKDDNVINQKGIWKFEIN